MERRPKKNVLFLCTGNYYRSRFAEILFNSVAGKMGLPWISSSRGLALDPGVNNVGPMSSLAVQLLETHGLGKSAETQRFPVQVTEQDFQGAAWIVALQKAEHEPLLQERFPAWSERVEYWHVNDDAVALGLIEREVMDLAARLIGGRKREQSTAVASVEVKRQAVKPGTVVRLSRETKGRRGKGVTIVNDLPADEEIVHELAAALKQRCGTGGTVKDGNIEIQGDQRSRLKSILEGMGYRVKNAGG